MSITISTLKQNIVDEFNKIVTTGKKTIAELKDISNAINSLGNQIVHNISIFNGSSFKLSVASLTDVYDNTISGDLVVVHGSTYDIGNGSIQLKDGVNWEFKGQPIITSSSSLGTFYDNGKVITTNWFGKPIIQNSNAFKNRITLSPTSSIKGFTDKIILKFDEFKYDGGFVGTIYSLHSDLGIVTPYYNSGDVYLNFDSFIANDISNFTIFHSTNDGNQVPNKEFRLDLKVNDYVSTVHSIALTDLDLSGYLMNGLTLELTLYYEPLNTIFDV